jgi:hypothetical protein
MKQVHVHIERLVLRGVTSVDRDAVVLALQAEIARQLREPGVAERLATAPSRPTLRPEPRVATAGAQALGQAAAQQLVRGLG